MDDVGHPGRVGVVGGQMRGHPAQQRKALQLSGHSLPSLAW